MYCTFTSRTAFKTILCAAILAIGNLSHAADYYWVGGAGIWTDLSHWATTSGGGTAHTIVPSPLDRVVFDANSFSANGQTVVTNFEVFCDRLEASNLGFQVEFDFNSGVNAASGIDVAGDLAWSHSGNLTIATGGLKLGADVSLTMNGALAVNGGGLDIATDAALILSGTGAVTGNTVIQANANFEITGNLTLDGHFNLISDNTYTQHSGETNVSNGDVSLGNNSVYYSKGGYWMRIYQGNLKLVSGASFIKDRGYIDYGVGDLVIPSGAIFNTGSGQRWIRNGSFIAQANSTITVNGDIIVLYDGGLELDPAANILTWNPSTTYFRSTQFGQHTIRSSGINLRRLQFDGTNHNAEFSLLDDLTALNDGVFLYANKFISNGHHIQAYHFYCWTTGVVAIDLTGTDSVNVSSQFRLYPSTNTSLTWDTPYVIWESTDHQYLYAGTNNSFDSLEFRANSTGSTLIQIQYSTTVKNVKVKAKGEQTMNLLNGSNYEKFIWEYEKNTINNPDMYMQGGNTFQDTFAIYSSGTLRPKLRTHGDNSFGVFDIGDRVREWEISAGNLQTMTEILPLTGSCERTILITSNTLGTEGKIAQATGTVSGDYLQLQDNDVSGGAIFNAINTADLGNVSGWNIVAIPGQDFHWIGENGNWSDPMNWSLTSGGAPYCAIPSRIDNVIFDVNSFTASGQFASVDVPAECNDMSWNGITTGAGMSNNQLLEIYGSLQLDANMNFAYTGRIDFQAIDANNTLETKGKTLREIRFLGQGQSTGVWTLVDDLSSSNWIYINQGTFNSDGNNITAYSISTSNSTVNFTNGTSLIQVQHRFEPNSTTTLDMGVADILFESSNQHMYFRYANGHSFNNVTYNQNSTGGYQVIIESNQNSSFKNVTVNQKGSSWVRWDSNLNNDYDTVIVNQTNRGFTRFYNTREDTIPVFRMLHTGTASYSPQFEIHSNSHSLKFGNLEYFGENNITPYFWADRGFVADTFSTRNLDYIRLQPSYTYEFDTLGIIGNCLKRTLVYSRTAGTQVTLEVASRAHADFAILKDINAAGSGTYTSGGTLDGGNVTGWPVGGGVNLYWIAGTGNWNDPNHWSLTSGGTPSGCLPSLGDNVFFDVNSFTGPNETVNVNTVASCHNMIWNNVNSPRLIGGSTLNIHGSLRLASNLTWSHTGWTFFQSRNTGNTITTNGVQLYQIQFLGDGIYTGEWTLQDDLDVRYDVYATYGSFVSGGHRLSSRSFFSNNNNVNTSVDFTGTDLITVRHRFELQTNPTFNFGSANIQWENMEGGYYRFYGYAKTFNDLLFDHDDGANRIELHHNNTVNNLIVNSTAYPPITINGNSTYNDINMVFNNNTNFIPEVSFTGSNNINILSITSLGNGGPYINLNNNNTFNDLVAAGLGTRLLLGANRTQTVNGLLALGNGSFPVFVKSQTDGTQATIYVAEGEVCLDFVLLQDIIGDGDPDGSGGIKTNYFAGNSSVDLGNNTNWQFSSCFAYYWVGDSGNWSDFANHWATSSGGTAFHSTVPGPTDNVYFDANSFTTNSRTVTVDVANAEAHNMTWQSALFTPTLTGNTQINIYGDLDLIPDMNQNFSGSWNMRADDNGNVLNTASQPLQTLNFLGGNDGEGEWTLQNALLVNADINLDNGALVSNSKDINAANFNSTTANIRFLQLGSSTVTITDGNWNPATLTDVTLDEGTSTIIITGTNTAGFLGNGLIYNDVTLTTSSSLSADLTGANTFNTLKVDPGLTLTVEPVTQTMTALEANASCDNLITIQSAVSGTPATFSQSAGIVNASFLNLKDNTAAGGATFNANFSNDNSGNTNWAFSAPPQLLVTTNTGAVDCVSNNDGFAEVTAVSGGTAPYTYLWSTSETTSRIENLIPGAYSVEVSDASGCSITEIVQVVNNPATITPTNFIASDTDICLGETINFTAGTPPESVSSYLWDFGDFSSSADQNPSHLYTAGGTYTVSLSYIDAIGCPAIVTETIIVSDLQVSIASNSIDCFGASNGTITITATGGAEPYMYSIDNGANYLATSAFSNLGPATYTLIVKDAFDCTTSAQAITLTEPATALSFTATPTNVSCSDATDGAISITASGGTAPYDYSINNGIAFKSDPSFTDLGFGSYNVLVRDDNNCVAIVQVVNMVVVDNTLPTITCPVDVSVTAAIGDCDAVVAVTSPSTSDNCGVASVINDFNSSGDASGTYSAGTTVVVWTVTDVNNNPAQCSMNVTVTESTDPTITCATAITVSNDAGQCDAAITVAAPAYADNCSAPPALTLSNDFNNTADASDTYPVGLTVVIWTTKDAAGNMASCTQDITVVDMESPSITCPTNVTMDTDLGSCDATNVVLGNATTSDNCTTVAPTNDAPTAYNLGTTTVTWTADHGIGNVVSCTQLVTVQDTEAPAAICATDFTVNLDAGQLASVDAAAINNGSVDNCGTANVSITSGEIAYDCDDVGQTFEVTLTVDDGNATSANSTCSTMVTVGDADGNCCDAAITSVTPDANCPSTITVNATCTTCAGLEYSINGTDFQNDAEFTEVAAGNYTVTARDTNDPSCSASTAVTVAADTEAPSVTCGTDLTANTAAGLCTSVVNWTTLSQLSFSDNCGINGGTVDLGLGAGPVAVTDPNASIGGTYPAGSTPVTYTISDAAGLTASCSFNVVVTDDEDPIITCPAAVTVSADVGLCTASSVSLGTAIATDNCTAITPTNDALPTFSVGTTPVTWTANDNNGQVVTCVQNVIVADNEAPIALCQDITVNLDVNSSYTLTAGEIDANSTDNCGISAISIPATTFDCDDLSGPVPVILTIVDNNNNSHTCTAQVTVADPLATCCAAPQASCQTATLSFQGNSSLTILPVDINAGSTADCGLVSMTVSPNTFNCADYVGSNLTVTNVNVTLTVEDINGATSACNTTVSIINDDNPPVFDCPANISVNNEPGLCTANITYDVTATDNCSTVSINQTEGLASGSDFPVGVTTNTFTANDVDNNSSTCSFTVTVIDTEAPTAVCQDITVVLEESGPSSVSDITISGTINQYAEVTAVGSNNVAVASAAGFGTGDKVLMIQMKGATIDLTNAATFGDVTAANEAGNYEYARIQSIVGSNITFISDLSKVYDPSKPVQLVRVPEYDNVIISGTLTAADWNGAIGGVLAFDAQGTVTLNANIDMKGKGFRGGNRSSNYYNGCENFTDYFIASPSIRAGDKGEGIADQGSAFGAGRGKAANGGGGGGSVNSGGGGGANYGAGGQGGREYVGCNQPLGGLGAATLSSLNLNDKIFLGGGGGGGQQNNSVSTNGADGGGIVLITANAIEGNGNQIIASGNDAINASNDGAGGGGAGGAVLLNIASVNSALSINLTGGKGGNSASGHGPAGGGGGGLFWHSGATLPTNVTPLLNGGLNGTAAGDPFGTSPGQSGGTLTHLAFPGVTTISATTIVLTDVDAGSTDNCTIGGITLSQTEFGCEHLGPNPVTLTVIDVNGLSDACNAVITVVENTPPALTCPADMTVDTEAGICEATVNFAALVSDNCDDAPNLTYSQNPGTVFSLGTTTVIVNATDVSTNNSSCSFDVTVVDNENPTITCAANVAVNNDVGECGAVVTLIAPAISDNCVPGNLSPAINDAPALFSIGTTDVTWSITDDASNTATCVQTVTVTDAEAPAATCTDITIDLIDRNTYSLTQANIDVIAAGTSDNCTGVTYAITAGTTDYDCDDRDAQFVLTLTATDAAGLTNSCNATVTIADPNSVCNDPPIAVCQDITIFTGANCDASIVAADVDGGSSDPDLDPLDLVIDHDGPFGVGTHTVILTVSDTEFSDNCTATITVQDNTPPTALCQDISVQLDAAGVATITTADINNGSTDACGIASLALDDTDFECKDIDAGTVVTLTVTDIHNNSSTCTANVTVEDNIDPVALCQDITIQLDATGSASITPAEIDNASTDACGLANNSLDISTFSCVNVGTNTVILTVTDIHTNESSCTAIVTVEDKVAPVAACQDLTIQLDASGNASITEDAVNDGSSDACNGLTFDTDITVFACANVGANPVILTVTDANNNNSTCTATITIEDKVAPIAICQDLTIQLDASGSASITEDAVNNGSSDACNGLTFDTDITGFACANVGDNPVVLTITDVNNNSTTCNAIITVEDKVTPVAICQDLTVALDATGNATITANDIDNGSSDACGIQDLVLDDYSFDCADVGTDQASNNYSLDFDGIDDWIDATGNGGAKASAASLGLPTQAITLEVYAYVNTFGIWKSFVSFIQDNGSFERGWDLETRTNGKFGFTLNSVGGAGGLTYMETTNSFNLGQWYHIAGTYDGTTMKIYVDGVLENTSIAENGDIWYADSWLALGVYKDDNEMNHLISGMDEVRIFDYAKTQAEIQATMSSTLSGTETGLVTYYAFEDGPGSSSVTDLSGNNHDGVLLNMDPATDWVSGSTASSGSGASAIVNLTVTDKHGNISTCAANVTVLDNTAPVALCQDLTIQLDANGDANITANDIDNGSSDACGIESLVLDETAFDCADVGDNEVELLVTDVNNNQTSCYSIVTVEDNIVPIAVCQDITVQLDAGTNNGDGSVSIIPEDIDNGSNDACGILNLSLDITDFDCAKIGTNPVILTVTDNNYNVTTCTAEVTVEDKIAPVISSCPIDQVLVNTAGDCSTLASWPIPAISDNCDTAPTGIFTAPGVNIVLNALGQFPVGSTTVTYTVTDDQNNETTCDFTITVTDIEPPTITSCPTGDIIVDNEAGLCEAEVDYGILVASDNCSGVVFTADTNHGIDGDIFEVGTTEVSFTATDAVGLQTVCSFNVTVNDTELPIATCEDITIQLDAGGIANILAADVFVSATDNCQVDNNSLQVDQSNFDCTKVGANTVTVSIDDIYGNTGTCTATVTVEDKVLPIAICQDLTVQLDASGLGSITTNDIDNGSNDACGLSSLSLDITDFACANVGIDNTVTLTVLDNNNNSSSCTAMVTVEDKIEPIALCQDVTVQLDGLGDGSITTNDIDNGSHDACGISSLSLNNNDFTCADVGNSNTVILTVTDLNGNISSCQSIITVEDKVAPIALCQDVTIQLDAAGNASVTASQIDDGSNDACGIDILSVTPSVFTCAEVGPNTVSLVVIDVNGNQSTCSAIVTVEDEVAPIALCQDLTLQLDALGSATIVAADVDNGSNDACGIGLLSLDNTDFDCTNVGTNTVILTVVDNNDQVSTCTATITVEDEVTPVALCQDLTIQLDAAGAASITAAAIDAGSSDACGVANLVLDITDFACNDVGAGNIVTLTVTDANNNISTCTATVTIEDLIAPIALCQDLSIQLDASGTASITAAEVDNGSNDACGIAGLSLDDTDFTCSDVGTNTVNLTVMDINGNSSICTANISVEDNIVPIAICQDVTVQLDASGNGTVTTAEIDNSSNDACGIFQLSLDNTDFSCAEVGSANTVTLTVVDNNDNSSTCTATVTVEDNVIPTALCQDVTVQLGPTGNVVIKPSQVDAGSNDACGIADVVLDITSFDCNDIVTNNIVTLTATDANGNTNTCTATITVEDNQAPVASCMSATVQLDDTGNGSITVTDIDGGSVDNCGISTRELNVTDFSCEDIGQLNFVTLTVTDLYGNVATCGAAVIVEDNLDPVADCEDIVVQLDATGQLTITPGDVDGGSNDACGVTPLFLDETTFTCADVGDNTVTLIVTDVNGNENTCTATVTVEDKVLPVANCQNLVVQLDDAGAASISPNQIDNGSSDACGLENISLDISDFSCANVGPNTVTLTVTDVNGNSSNCPAIVTVQDQVSPIALCQDITVLLDATGAISILATDIDNGSNDACGIGSLDLDISTFDCTHIDANTVTLTVTDNNSNVSTCTATVTVMDHVAPVAICQDLTIQLDANGTALVPATAVDNGSNDACGIADYSFLMGATELITNGGFDTNNAGWTISGVHVTYFNSGGNPGGWLWLNGVGSGGFDPSASQTLSGLTVGQSYLINGSTRNHANCCGAFVGQAALAIDIDGIEQTTVNNPGTTWTDFSYSFTATSTSHTVTFRSEINGNDTDMAIDNISISVAAMSVASKSFDCTQVGPNVMSLQVTDNNGNTTTCQATITIQDKVDPIALCQDITIQLGANGLASITTAMIDDGSNDACGIADLSLDNTDFSCSDVGANTVSLTVIDNNDNLSTCTANVTVEDNVAPLALCQDITIQLDASGVASISTNLIDAGSNDACGIANLALDDTAFDCTDIGANTVSLTVTDNNGNVATCSAQVTVQDNVTPVASCQDITIQLDASGAATITTTDIDAGSNDACGIANLTLDDAAFDCADVGGNTVTLTVTDNNTNSSTCTAVVTVEDNVAPLALCQNVTLQLDASGAASLSTADVDAGSNDACGVASITLDDTDFNCADVGTNTVTLTVSDQHANVSTCTATITVEDNVAPIALCQDLTVQLDAAGDGSITANDVDAGSSDACGFANLVLDATDFSCTDIGANTVTLTTTDNNGNVSTCSATVTVEDNIAPIALCQDVTIQLDANGQADITTTTIDAGPTDACGLASISLDVTDFDCSNIGSNTVTMTVIDNNSNQSSCTATVTVEDKVAPIALCQDVTIQLNAAGAANISATDIDAGSNDACGIAHLSLDITAFDCNDVGTNTVSLIVNDNNGNTTNCIATVTVEDNIAPIALCQDITVQLDNLGQAAILPQDLDNGSHDACGLIYQVDVATFDCSDVNQQVVVALTVTDPSNNSASCIATVRVEDNIAPLALCQDITIQLDAQGLATITEATINANSSDACGIADLSLNLTDFNCEDVGANTVTLTITDVNANVSTCSATVTVEDDIAPIASCKDVTITLDDNGLATLETDDVVVSPPGFANFVDSGQRLSRKRTEGVVLADFDSDGDLDAFTANYKQGNRVWLNNGAAHFNSNGQNLGRYKSCGIDAGDLDGDGDIDAFLGNYGQGNKVWLNNGNARFSQTNQSLSNKRSLGLKLGDLDGDGDLDAFVANDGQGNKVWLNNGLGQFSWRGQHLGHARSHDVSLGDLDGDGDLDAFVANYGQGNRVWLNNGQGWFSATNQSLVWFESKGVELADLDNDGDLDAFIANEGRPNRIWLNNGQAHFTDAGEYLGNNYSTAVALGDIDADNDLDAFVTNHNQGNKTWLNGGGAAFSHGGQYLGHNPSTDVKLGDLDGDGDLDAFVSNYDKANWVWLNDYDSGISDNCGIASVELSDQAFDCFELGTHQVTVTVTDVHNNSGTCTATVTVLSQSGYDTADINNNGNLDDDCDGVADACDVCPGADDSLDSDNDGIPDCKDYEGFHTIPNDWKCGWSRRHGATKVEICHVPYGNPDNAHTICVSQRSVTGHLNHHAGDYLGPCFQITCGDNIAEEETDDGQDALQRANHHPEALTDAKIFADSLAASQLLDIKLFPNPADHESFLDWRNHTGEQATVRIFNQLGQMVKEIEVDEITTPWLHLDLSKYEDGVYNVRVEIVGYVPTTHKLIVTKSGRTIKP